MCCLHMKVVLVAYGYTAMNRVYCMSHVSDAQDLFDVMVCLCLSICL